MSPLLQQIKTRRQALGLKQNDMLLRIGVSRQQYQLIEAKGNPRLETLELIAKGLSSQLLLIPNEKLSSVLAILNADDPADISEPNSKSTTEDKKPIADDPWQGLLGDES
jgi:transcriptional regulator with XRE-family HTH domain